MATAAVAFLRLCRPGTESVNGPRASPLRCTRNCETWPVGGGFILQNFQPKGSFRSHTIGKHGVTHAGQQGSQFGIIHTGCGRAVKRDAIHKVEERALHIFHVAIAIHVLAIDIGDDGEDGR